MKYSNIPHLPRRLYPELTRDVTDFDGDHGTSRNCRFILGTGDAPTNDEIYNLVNLEDYVTTNPTKIILDVPSMEFVFNWDPLKRKRTIQKNPVDAETFTAGNNIVTQSGSEEITTPNDMWMILHVPDIDDSLNTLDNDLIIFTPNVGDAYNNNVSLNRLDFAATEEFVLLNATISLFDGYQITDTPILDEESNPIGSVKSTYLNKVFTEKMSEAYRNLLVDERGTNATDRSRFNKIPYFTDAAQGKIYDTEANLVGTLEETTNAVAFLVNDGYLEIIETLNNMFKAGTFPKYSAFFRTDYWNDDLKVFEERNVTAADVSIVAYSTGHQPATLLDNEKWDMHQNVIWLMLTSDYADVRNGVIDTLAEFNVITQELADRAKKCIIPINNTQLNPDDFISSFDRDQQILTVSCTRPVKLGSRFKQSVHNPAGEGIWLFFPTWYHHNHGAVAGHSYNSHLQKAFNGGSNQDAFVQEFVETNEIMNGTEIIDTTPRIKQYPYSAYSLGLTGNGLTDIELNSTAIIDYIDTLTVMFKVPNKF